MGEPLERERVLRLVLPAVAESVSRARTFALDASASCHLECDTLALVASELVTNAVRYSSGDVEITITPGSNQLRVEVRDNSPEVPALRRAGPHERSGRGLAIVEVSAIRWWVRPNGDGTKTVGADVECRSTPTT